MSSRTLQRRITEEGSTFRQLLSDARSELARRYLEHPSFGLSETASLLGYEDPNSFLRAFRVWEGVTPTEWRAMQKAGLQETLKTSHCTGPIGGLGHKPVLALAAEGELQ
jgi:AraC-like DNA-binding protein